MCWRTRRHCSIEDFENKDLDDGGVCRVPGSFERMEESVGQTSRKSDTSINAHIKLHNDPLPIHANGNNNSSNSIPGEEQRPRYSHIPHSHDGASASA